jgi:hypothetical protein
MNETILIYLNFEINFISYYFSNRQEEELHFSIKALLNEACFIFKPKEQDLFVYYLQYLDCNPKKSNIQE